MKVTFEGFEFSMSMGAISIDIDPAETESIINADVRKHEISEGDTDERLRKTIYSVVKDAVGSAVAQQKPKDTEPKPTPYTACTPKPEPNACLKPVEEDCIVDAEPEKSTAAKKKFGPKRRASQE